MPIDAIRLGTGAFHSIFNKAGFAKSKKRKKGEGKTRQATNSLRGSSDQYFFIESHVSMPYGVSNETPWNSDAYDTKNVTILPKISISLDLPTKSKPKAGENNITRQRPMTTKQRPMKIKQVVENILNI